MESSDEISDYSNISSEETFSKRTNLKTMQHRSNLQSKLISTPKRSQSKYKTPCKDYVSNMEK